MPTASQPLPRVVAGPILRRVEPEQVCVWIATSFAPASLELAVLDVSKPHRHEGLGGSSNVLTVAVGSELFISLVTARPPAKKVFPVGSILGYELWYTHTLESGATEKRDLLADAGAFSYGNLGKPSFRVSDAARLVVLHGSCRKPDGQGRDALAAADTLIGRVARDRSRRPELMVMTGDQIYANSIAPPLLALVQTVARRLTGFDEHVPTPRGAQALSALRADSPRNPRARLAQDAGFNAERGHLFGVTEAISLYLLSWSAALWSREMPATRDYVKFVGSLPAVQRAMANIPVYMIFDDHEVTDDWNLHQPWVEAVRGNELGRRAVTNILVAYWLCQAWGNDPGRFDARFIERVRTYLSALAAGGGRIEESQAKDIEDLMWNFHDWGYVIPSRPPIFVLDTRTQRELGARGEPAALLDETARRRLDRDVRASTYRRGDPLLMVAPTPVFGMLFAEAIDRQIARTDGPEAADFEHWRFHTFAHHRFIRWILEDLAPGYTIFLSGDVHYAFTADVDYMLDPTPLDQTTRDAPASRDLARAGRFFQFTSSPLKNENPTTIRGRWRLASWAVDHEYNVAMWDRWDLSGVDLLNSPVDRIDWRLNSPKADYLYAFFSADLVTRHPEQAHPLVWREVGRYHRYRPDWAAPYYPYANLAEVTVTANGISHNLVVRTDDAQLEPAVAQYGYATKP